MFCLQSPVGGRVGSDGCREVSNHACLRQEMRLEGQPLSKPDMPGEPLTPPLKSPQSSPGPLRGQRDLGLPGEGSQVVKVCTVIVRMPPVDKADEGGHLSPGPESNLSPPTAPASQNSKEKTKMVSSLPARMPGLPTPPLPPPSLP